jgi:hypothetical protein
VKAPVLVPAPMSGFVTTTFLAPAVPAGVVHVNDVADTNTTEVHAAPPTVTVAPLTKFAPVMVIGVPPPAGPFAGETDDTAGTGSKVKAPAPVPTPVSGFVTTTFLAPAVPAGVVHVNDVADTNVTDVHAAPPTVTVAPLTKFVPEIVIDVPPPAGPFAGETDDTVGTGLKVKAPAPVPARVLGLVTTMSLAPAVPAGVVHVNDVADTNATEVHAAPPTVTVAPLTKSVPVIVIDVPPLAGPFAGETDDTVGAVPNTKPLVRVREVPPTLVTTTSALPDPAGVVHVKDVDDDTATEVQADPPTVTVAPLAKFVPVIVIDVPPTSGPELGATELIVGRLGAVIVTLVVFLFVPAVSRENTMSKVPVARPMILKPPDGSATGVVLRPLVLTGLPDQSVRDQEPRLVVEMM